MAIMVDRGYLDFDKEVASYWPEFAQNNKGDIKVSDVLRHQSGLSMLKEKIDVDWTKTENIFKNKVGSMIEKDYSYYPFDEKRHYHAITRDLITNEIFRRVEPQGRTMSQFLRDEITGPLLDNADIHVTVPEDKIKDCFDFEFKSKIYEVLNLLMPLSFGRKGYLDIFYNIKMLFPAIVKIFKFGKINPKAKYGRWLSPLQMV